MGYDPGAMLSRRFLRTVSASLPAAPFAALGMLTLALALVSAPPRSHAASVSDGEWAVELVTNSGPCRPTYNHPVRIRDGTVSGLVEGRTGTYAIKGTASADGQVEWETTGGPDPGVFKAATSGDQGRGEWSTRSCRGVLSMRRQ